MYPLRSPMEYFRLPFFEINTPRPLTLVGVFLSHPSSPPFVFRLQRGLNFKVY